MSDKTSPFASFKNYITNKIKRKKQFSEEHSLPLETNLDSLPENSTSDANLILSISNLFEECYSEIAQLILRFQLKYNLDSCALDDIPALLYSVGDIAAFSSNKDRQEVSNAFNIACLTTLGKIDDGNLIFKFGSTTKGFIQNLENRLDFYCDILSGKLTPRALCLNNFVDVKTLDNKFLLLSLSFCDIIIDSDLIEDYDTNHPQIDAQIAESTFNNIAIPLSKCLALFYKEIYDM